MMKRHILLSVALISGITAFAQTTDTSAQGDGTDTILHRIFLVGDAGELHGDTHPVVDWLRKNVNWNDERNSVIYLGDNIYPLGLPMEGEASYPEAKAIIDSQINLVRGKNGKAFFIPGNHDWKNGKIGGWQQNINQVNYINGQQLKNVQAWPLEGCPGPIEVELDEKVVLVLMDSQWFLHLHDKPGPGSGCDATSIDEFVTQLQEIVATHPDQLLVLAMHHPMYSYGPHGGDYTWRHHIFPLAEAVHGLYIPLPVLGSVYPIARGLFGNLQDTKHPLYRNMSLSIEEVIKEHPNPIVVAGHDHSLQLIRKDSIPHIVSGSGAKLTRVKKNSKAEFTDVNFGLSLIEVRKSGKVEIKFYNIDSKNLGDPTYVTASKPITPKLPIAVAVDTMATLPLTATVPANAKLEGGWLKNLLMGKNYRAEWTTPVTVPVLDIGKERGGLTPTRQGGGKQTRSLRLEEKSGKEWVLRSIEKFPEAALPADLRGGVANTIVEDGISASYPYASLSIAPLARALGIPQIQRKLVFVPDDPRLQRFRTTFANNLAVLEEREPANVKKTDNTDELAIKLAKDNDDHVDQKAVLRARLLDNFIMDFDRHEDQWRWATYDTGKGKMYYPIPRDHDQAFYKSGGLIPSLARKPWLLPQIQGLQAKAKNIKTFNRAARNFDRFFLTELSQKDWQAQIDTFLTAMTDDVIEQSLRQQPAEVQPYAASSIASTLKRRRDFFRQEMLDYYRFISREVNVLGSDQREQFTITKNEDGSVQVVVNKIDKQEAISSKIYDRVFTPDVTKEVRLYGMKDNDRFIIEGGASPIKVRIIGGSGIDEFLNQGTGGQVLVYDAQHEEKKITGAEGLQLKISNDPLVNSYSRLNYKYDQVIPGFSAGYNVDDGLFLGAQLEATLQGFRKEPYAQRHFIRGARALKTSSYRFRYEGDFMRVIGHHDLIIRADVRAPVNVTNFFGIGNDTYFDKSKPGGDRYYRARYDVAGVSVLMRRQPQSWMRVNYGATYQYFNVEREENKGRFLSQTLESGLDSTTLYTPKSFGGLHFKLDINSQNNRVLPTRGFVLDANVRPMLGLNGHSSNLVRADFDMRLFASIFRLPRLVVATRLGYGRNFGKFEFPQAYYLGGMENLRGYRRDRFAGRTMFFNNTEVRFRVADFTTFLFPGSLGVLVFNDVGRVWADGERSTDWHVGNGVGVWLSPVRRFVITGTLARSKEEKALPMVTFGFQF